MSCKPQWLQFAVCIGAMNTQDAQRILLGALNGLAGVLLLENETQAAIAAFRQVLSIGAHYSTSTSLVAFI